MSSGVQDCQSASVTKPDTLQKRFGNEASSLIPRAQTSTAPLLMAASPDGPEQNAAAEIAPRTPPPREDAADKSGCRRRDQILPTGRCRKENPAEAGIAHPARSALCGEPPPAWIFPQ